MDEVEDNPWTDVLDNAPFLKAAAVIWAQRYGVDLKVQVRAREEDES